MEDIIEGAIEAEKSEKVSQAVKDFFDALRNPPAADDDNEQTVDDDVVDEPPVDPLLEAMRVAIHYLNEIKVYAEYGKSSICAREAAEALEKIEALKAKFDLLHPAVDEETCDDCESEENPDDGD